MTIKEIAKLSGVGVSTVSRYLNNGYVSDEKRLIIKRVIEENNYQRNQSAVNMRGKSHEVVIIVQRVSSSTTSRFLEGIIKQCEIFSYTPTIYVVNFNEKIQNDYIKAAIDRKVRGIVVYSFTDNLEFEFSNLLVVGQNSQKYKSIYSNGKKIYKKLVTNIIKKNDVNKIEILGINILDVEFVNRVAGAIEAAKSHNVPYKVWEENFDSIHQQFKLESGTYYVCLTDAQAYKLIQMANEQQLKIGEDIFISGYGDYSTSSLLELTTVDGLYEEVGSLAIKSIADKNSSSQEINPIIKYRKSARDL